jgi:putative membrane protein
MYEWAMLDHNVHIVEHVMFMASAVVMWWPAYSRISEIPALTPGYRMLYLFALTIPMKALGAVITISDYVLYPFYSTQPRVFGLDPFEDQRFGGLLMWMPGGLVFWFTIGWVFLRSFYGQVNRQRRGAGAEHPASLIPTVGH